MNIRLIDRDVLIGLCATIIGLFMYNEADKLNAQASIFPKVILGIFIILSVLLLFQGIRKSIKNKYVQSSNTKMSISDLKIPFIMFLFILLYVILLDKLGFYISTAIFIPIVMLFYKDNNMIKIITTTFGTILFIVNFHKKM
ncbi:tripartite tricarboxylate transporter TctB family protein [Acidaminobacter hydrogenoformans]|uniref:Tripartite tricarboxylate transporter TctB family protein n=1 Tax=Acidaminobacter hydrogenoformans DSM 2784 TaxID=1120920 RepID=A0A1G5S199_9FIRM|nr:tripartite tricarboxylate transporter TctB family protein [Acidaminobacter hydrogenoformans]SCZ79511.1 Tripartite tricarboxylate transporter TctB family protein [Acidaminobacter hydrogenoformans DSM 2784]